jgi:hypothetical protein
MLPKVMQKLDGKKIKWFSNNLIFLMFNLYLILSLNTTCTNQIISLFSLAAIELFCFFVVHDEEELK